MHNTEKKEANAKKHSKRKGKSGSSTRAKKPFLTTEVIPLPKPELTEYEVNELRYMPTSVKDVLHSAMTFGLEYRVDGEEIFQQVRDEIFLSDLFAGDKKDKLFCFFKDLEDLLVKTYQAYGELDIVTTDEAVVLYFWDV